MESLRDHDDDRELCEEMACPRLFRLDDCSRDACPKVNAVHICYIDDNDEAQVVAVMHGLPQFKLEE